MKYHNWHDEKRGTVTMTKKEFNDLAQNLICYLISGLIIGHIIGFILGGGIDKFFGG